MTLTINELGQAWDYNAVSLLNLFSFPCFVCANIYLVYYPTNRGFPKGDVLLHFQLCVLLPSLGLNTEFSK